MTKPKLTPWIDGCLTKPAHKGLYETSMAQWCGEPTMIGYQYWDGEKWGMQSSTKKAAASKPYRDAKQEKFYKWRGLAENPNKGKKK